MVTGAVVSGNVLSKLGPPAGDWTVCGTRGSAGGRRVGWFLGVPLIPIKGPESAGQQTIARESQCDVHHRSPVPKTESAVCAVHDYNSVGGLVEVCFAAGVPIARGVAALWVDDHA